MAYSKQTSLEKWKDGISYEVAFWNNVYRWKRTYEGMMGWSLYGKCIELEQFDANHYLSNISSPKILDVGCGMSYATGNFIKRGDGLKEVEIHYVDPLASHFNKILHRYHRPLPAIEFGMAEYLSAFYPNHDIDLVIMQNALDHSADPLKGIFEAIDILKPGGILYLNHHPNEAETEHYKGFHQYNISQNADQLIIWNKKQHWNINTLVGPFAEVTTSVHNNGHIIAVVRKKADVPADMLSNKKDLCELAEQLITVASNQSVFSACRQTCRYVYYNTVQFFAQALPWKVKMAVKRFIKQA